MANEKVSQQTKITALTDGDGLYVVRDIEGTPLGRYIEIEDFLDGIDFQIIIDETNAEAFLVRADGDGGDVFIIDTTNKQIIVNNDGGNAAQKFRTYSDTAWQTGLVQSERWRGSVGSEAIVQADDVVFEIRGKAYDGAALQDLAKIKMEVDATPGSGDMPGRISFYTTADGASSVTEALRIDSSQIVSIRQGTLKILERSSDPAEPSEGEMVIWMSDGTGKGDDGDIMVASQAGSTTNYGTLFDHSGGSGW